MDDEPRTIISGGFFWEQTERAIRINTSNITIQECAFMGPRPRAWQVFQWWQALHLWLSRPAVQLSQRQALAQSLRFTAWSIRLRPGRAALLGMLAAGAVMVAGARWRAV